MSTTVLVIDRGWNDIQRKIGAVGSIYVGLLGAKAAKAYPDGHGETTAEIGAVHEYGDEARNIPQRSFLRSTIRKNQERYIKLLAKAAAEVVFEGKPDLAMLKVGLIAAGDVRMRIAEGIPPALSEKTIARKGSSTPLIDTGQLRSSIDAEVRK
jgi:phage gpG-like protein